MENTVLKALEFAAEQAKAANEINKRLTTTIKVVVIALAVTIILMCGFYFFSDYQIPDMSQTTTDDKTEQTIK